MDILLLLKCSVFSKAFVFWLILHHQKINTLSLQPIGSSVAVWFGLFFAFLSYWLQADALIGPDGLNPWQADLQAIENLCHDQGKESRKWILRPTILWLDSIGNHHFIF